MGPHRSLRPAVTALVLAMLAGCGPKMPDSVRSALPPGPGTNAGPSPATPPRPVVALPPVPAATARAIAIAEDQRRYTDGVLKRFLADPAPEVRVRAALAVGRLQDSTTVADLIPLLNDASAEVRREAAFALGQIGRRAARLPLESRLTDGDPETVDLAIEALGKLGDTASTPRVAAFLRSGSPELRGEAAVALWRLADSTALPDLLGAQGDPDPEVRWRVLYALEKIVAPVRVVLVAALHLNDSDAQSRASAARTLGRQKSTRASAYLLGVMGDPATPVVVNAIRALQQIGDSTTRGITPALIRQLSHHDSYVRLTAATALGERFAFAGLDSAGQAAWFDSLAAHLTESNPATRGAIARALLRQGGVRGRDRVGAMMHDDPSIYSRAEAIGAWPGGDSGSLLHWLERTNPLFLRMTAADRLGELKERTALPALRAGLADSAFLFVASCAGALAALKDNASVPTLARAWSDHAGGADSDARVAIRDALRELAGRGFADSLERAHPARGAVPDSFPPDFAVPPTARGAIFHTTAGDMEWAFYGREAPQTVKNFVRLAERGYFNGLRVHRVVPNFVIQDGDPTGTGSGGPGYTIRCEYNRLRYEAGMVGMALSGKDTGGSQWFVTQSPQMHLNGRYTIFAHVVRGMDVVTRIVQQDQVLKVEILR